MSVSAHSSFLFLVILGSILGVFSIILLSLTRPKIFYLSDLEFNVASPQHGCKELNKVGITVRTRNNVI